MKKTTLLSLLTAGAIVATGAGTYAAWDKLEDTSEAATVTFRSPVTVDVATFTLSQTDNLGGMPSASGEVTINVQDKESKTGKLTIIPTVTGGTGATNDDFDITLTDTTAEHSTVQPEGNSSTGFIDSDIIAANTYTVTITPKAGSESKAQGSPVSVTLRAQLSSK